MHYEFMGTRVANDLDPGRQGKILRSSARLVDRGLMRVHVGAHFPLERVADAHGQIETGRTIGKLAVVVAT